MVGAAWSGWVAGEWGQSMAGEWEIEAMSKVDELRAEVLGHAAGDGYYVAHVVFPKVDALIEAARAEGRQEVLDTSPLHHYEGQPECVWCGHFGPNDDPEEPCIRLVDITARYMTRLRDQNFQSGLEKGIAQGREEERALHGEPVWVCEDSGGNAMACSLAYHEIVGMAARVEGRVIGYYRALPPSEPAKVLDLPMAHERCIRCSKQYCDGYDASGPIHRDCQQPKGG